MIVLIGRGDAEADDDVVKERNGWCLCPGKRVPGSKVGSGREDQFVHGLRHLVTFQQGLVATSVVVGDGFFQQGAQLAIKPVQRNRYAVSRHAVRRVQYMRREFAHAR